jgi:hypothetical protein
VAVPNGDCRIFINLVAPETGRLIASQICGSQGPTLQITLVELDRATARVTRTLVTGPAGQNLGPTTVDSSGRFLLYETEESIPPDVVISDSNPAPTPHEWLLSDGMSTPFPQADAYYGLGW